MPEANQLTQHPETPVGRGQESTRVPAQPSALVPQGVLVPYVQDTTPIPLGILPQEGPAPRLEFTLGNSHGRHYFIGPNFSQKENIPPDLWPSLRLGNFENPNFPATGNESSEQWAGDPQGGSPTHWGRYWDIQLWNTPKRSGSRPQGGHIAGGYWRGGSPGVRHRRGGIYAGGGTV